MKPLDWIKSVLVEVDPQIKKYSAASHTGEYTVWTPGAFSSNDADDMADEDVITVYVDRFTRNDKDPIPEKLARTFAREGISFEHVPIYENEGYIHHSFTCSLVCGHNQNEEDYT